MRQTIREAPSAGLSEKISREPVAYWNPNPLPGGFGMEIAILLVGCLSIAFGPSFGDSIALVSLGYLAYCVFVYVRSRRALGRAAAKEGDGRILCRGNAADLAFLGELSTEFKEPYIASPTAPPTLIAAVVSLLVIPLVVFALLLFLAFGKVLAFTAMCLTMVVGRLAVINARPTYYRVSPGRLEILKFWSFSRRVSSKSTFDLRAARVDCRFDEGFMWISTGSDQVRIPLVSLWNPRRFAKAVFECALTKEVAPPLPDDELLG